MSIPSTVLQTEYTAKEQNSQKFLPHGAYFLDLDSQVINKIDGLMCYG